MNFLQDDEGNYSSKRLAGFIGLLVAGLLSALIITRRAEDGVKLVEIWAMYSGACLGIGVVEKFGIKKEKTGTATGIKPPSP